MFKVRRIEEQRRGVVLILILGMLALLALIGVTFASFSGQAQIGARNFALAYYSPSSDEVMDFALDQLISGTRNPMSAIRGHDLARDMYGNDTGGSNGSVGMLVARPDNGNVMMITNSIVYTTNSSVNGVNIPPPSAKLATNITAGDPAFYGYNFTRWVVKIAYCNGFAADGTPIAQIIPPVAQSFEIVYDDNSGSDTDFPGMRVFHVSRMDAGSYLYNPSSGVDSYLATPPIGGSGAAVPFMIDGRFLRAFNGTGVAGLNHFDSQNMDANGNNQLYIHAGMYANYRVNGGILNPTPNANSNASIPSIGHPTSIGLDEDYDAPDLENWFLALQSADGRVMIPSFHRPGILTRADWTNTVANAGSLAATLSMAKILRPRAVDHPTGTFPDLVPNAGGNITYDVDNDGDGTTDSVWLDLGYPVQRDAQGRAYKPLYAFLVLGLNGRLPLNTAGNIQARDFNGNPSYDHASHIGFSVNEINPKYALNPNSTDNSSADTTDQWVTDMQASNAAVTQLRNLLTGTRPQPNPYSPSPLLGDSNSVGSIYMPNNIVDSTDGTNVSLLVASNIRNVPAVKGRWGEQGNVPTVLYTPASTDPSFLAFNNYVRAGHSPASLGWGELSSGNYTPSAHTNSPAQTTISTPTTCTPPERPKSDWEDLPISTTQPEHYSCPSSGFAGSTTRSIPRATAG